MCSSLINIISVSILLIHNIDAQEDPILIDDDSVSLYIHTEKQILFRDANDLNMNIHTEWCLFYNVDDVSNHLYCVSTLSSPFTTECHSMNNKHYTFTNISLCDSNKITDIHISSAVPIIGTFIDNEYICDIYRHQCCKLNTKECFINTGNNDIQINDNQVLIIPFTDGFLEFTLDTASISCITTNQNVPKCNLMPPLWTPPDTMILFDAVFISSTSILFLFTDESCSTLYVQKCTIFTRDPGCRVLSDISISDANTADTDSNKEINVIGHNECIILLSIIANDHDISYILLYNYCNNQIQQIDTEHIYNNIIYNVLHNYIANYRITDVDENTSELSCFILNDEELIIQCLSFILQSNTASLTPTSISSTIELYPDVYRNVVNNDNNIPNNGAEVQSNGFWPYSDASFITVIVVSGIVIVSCLICGLMTFSKCQKERQRKEWYKERELNKNKHKKSKSIKRISTINIPNTSRDPSFGGTIHTMYESDVDSICKSKSIYSRRVYSASYPAIPTNAMLYETHPPPPPPPGPPPIGPYKYKHKANRSRKTKISHRTLYKFPDAQGETSDDTDDITPLATNNQQKRFEFTNRMTNSILSSTSSIGSNMSRFPRSPSTSIGYDYFDESSVSSETLVFQNSEKQQMSTRPSQSLPDNMSTLSRCSIDENEDEEKHVSTPMPMESKYKSELTKQLKLRKRPKITRRCTDSDDERNDNEAYTYHNVNINDVQSEDDADDLQIIYTI